MASVKRKNLVESFLEEYRLEGPNFIGTPDRIVRMWERFFNHYTTKPDMTTFPSDYKGIVMLEGHEAWGFCPHHLLPVRYTFTIAYIPKGHVLGVSKLARLAEYHLRTLPLQEDLTMQIAEDLYNSIECEGAVCIIKGYHLCYVMRGVKSSKAKMTTAHNVGKKINIQWSTK